MTEREYVRPPTRSPRKTRGLSEPDQVQAGGGGGPNMAPELPVPRCGTGVPGGDTLAEPLAGPDRVRPGTVGADATPA